jgi:outer membrane lipoprotein LolB
MNFFQKFFLLTFCLLLSACQAPIESSLGVTDNREVPYWTLEGDFIFIAPKERFRASLLWRQAPDQQQLKLISQFGQTLMQVDRQLRQTQLWFDNRLYRGLEAEALIYDITHWYFPIEPMHDWVLGHPTQGTSQRVYNNSGQLKSFRVLHKAQLWLITYPEWHERHKLPFPKKIEIQNLTQKMTFKLNVKDWNPQW